MHFKISSIWTILSLYIDLYLKCIVFQKHSLYGTDSLNFVDTCFMVSYVINFYKCSTFVSKDFVCSSCWVPSFTYVRELRLLSVRPIYSEKNYVVSSHHIGGFVSESL